MYNDFLLMLLVSYLDYDYSSGFFKLVSHPLSSYHQINCFSLHQLVLIVYSCTCITLWSSSTITCLLLLTRYKYVG